MIKKLIIFDLDGTLAMSRMSLTPHMGELLCKLLSKRRVAIISGSSADHFFEYVLPVIRCVDSLHNLYILPCTGTELLIYKENSWQLQYKHPLSQEEKDTVIKVLEQAIQEPGVPTPPEVFGPQIQDRDTQITFSWLGQEAPLSLKEAWDPNQELRKKLADYLETKLPEYAIGIGGTTSIDITKKKYDKAYGITTLLHYLSLTQEEVLFIGDALFPEGNDFSAKKTGVETHDVDSIVETIDIIERLIREES